MPKLQSGTKTITTAGSRVALAANAVAEGVAVVARIANAGAIFVGDDTVDNSTNAGLQPGDSLTIPGPVNLGAIWLDAATSGDIADYYASIR